MVNIDVVLHIDDLKSYSAISICRICHEEEFESCKTLEAPCSCSGTVKFAHRDCVQRWCNEKGNTVCEICLQKFEPGYTTILKKAPLDDTIVNIRANDEIPRREAEEVIITEDLECTSADRNMTCCRRVVILFTIMLLAKHLVALFAIGSRDDYQFSLATVIIIKTGGILAPIYLLLRILTALQESITYHQQDQYLDNMYEEE